MKFKLRRITSPVLQLLTVIVFSTAIVLISSQAAIASTAGELKGVEVIVASPSRHSIRSTAGNLFLHLIYDFEDVRNNVVYNFDANLPYKRYDLRQLFDGSYRLELRQQNWQQFRQTEVQEHGRTLRRFVIPSTRESREQLLALTRQFPNISGLPDHYAAMTANCTTMGLTLLHLAGLTGKDDRPPFLPLLAPGYLRKHQISTETPLVVAPVDNAEAALAPLEFPVATYNRNELQERQEQ